MPRTYVALDLELTGLDRGADEIIEVALVRFCGHQVLETWSSLVYTQRTIPARIEQLVGISQRDIAHAPSFADLRGTILRFIGTSPLVAHSIENDLFFLQKQGLTLHNMAIDTFELASILVPEAHTYSLSALAEKLGIPMPQAHRALEDALATKALFVALFERLKEWDVSLLQELTQIAQQAEWPLQIVFQDALEEKAPIQILGHSQRDPSETYSLIPKEKDAFPPLNPTAEITPLDPEPLVKALSPGGDLARAFAGYEHRPQQIEMLKAVIEAFNTPCHLIVEAGTGVGKSLAYLLPAIHFSWQNGRRVVVSSNTINLQDQLYTKDIPALQRLLPFPFRVALLKGRGNYLCLRRLAALRRTTRLSLDEARVLAKVLAWLPHTQTGDQAELLLLNEETNVWQKIQSTPETCIGERCPYLKAGQCFFFRARSRAERAHVIIVNHALLLSDLVLENRILPDYDYLIIDEAHHLEEQATHQFSIQISRNDLITFLYSLSQPTSTAPTGLLSEIPAIFSALALDTSLRETITRLIREIQTQIETAIEHTNTLYRALETFIQSQGIHLRSQSGYDRHIRITSGLRIQPEWSEIEIAWDNLAIPLGQIIRALEALANIFLHLPEENEISLDLLQDIQEYIQRGRELYAGLEKILAEPTLNDIDWLSISQYDQELALNSAPLQVADLLKERLFDAHQCVILTSATLRTDQGFRYIRERIGLEEAMEVALDSPFDYESAVLLYVPKDIPEPNEPNYQKSIQEAIVDLVRATEGRALVLFTSNSQLHATYRATRRKLENEGIIVFGQGIDGSRRQILESFRSTPRAVLMGTRSFWEGIDVVGEALSCLIIARLPFGVPTDPILSARAETFEDPFNEYYLPETILRFRQGFGRLIRSKNDYGIIAVLDKRLITKAYGKAILRALPRCTARMGPVSTLPILAKRWLAAQTLTDMPTTH